MTIPAKTLISATLTACFLLAADTLQANEAELHLTNLSGRVVRIFYNHQGREELNGTMQPGEAGVTQTYFGHSFVYRDARTGQELARTTARYPSETIQIRGHQSNPITPTYDSGSANPTPEGNQVSNGPSRGPKDRLKNLFNKLVDGRRRGDEGADNPQPPSAAAYDGQILLLVNRERARYGLNPVTLDPALSAASLDHSRDMLNEKFFSHTSPLRGKASPWERAANFGTSANAENIAMGQQTPESVMQSWMNSPGHRQNILSPSASRMGIGMAGNYWTQMFGN